MNNTKYFSALSQSLTPILQSSFREVFTTVVIPGFERATQNLYANLSTSFTKVFFIYYTYCILVSIKEFICYYYLYLNSF